jgi:hypothetical protein
MCSIFIWFKQKCEPFIMNEAKHENKNGKNDQRRRRLHRKGVS